jgi:DnaJ like chaperone protein
MAWWGKVVGGALGFMLGGPIGALLGGVVGHKLDKGIASFQSTEDGEAGPGDRERVQTAFFTATFSVLGHMAKADGRVSPQEIALAEAVIRRMDLTPETRAAAITLFNQGKGEDFDLDGVLDQFRRECHRRATLLQMFIEIQIQAAYADGLAAPAERHILQRIREKLGVPEFIFSRLEHLARMQWEYAQGGVGAGAGTGPGGAGAGWRQAEPQGPTLEQAYGLLGVSPQADEAEIKRAYRRLLSQHHPDKLVSKGLPEEMMKLAAHKTHEIRQAYERIMAARKG